MLTHNKKKVHRELITNVDKGGRIAKSDIFQITFEAEEN